MMSDHVQCRNEKGKAIKDELSDDDFDWEDGNDNTVSEEKYEESERKPDWDGQVTFTMDENTAPDTKARTTKPPLRRATAKDREFSLLVHKAHLLCLLCRGRIVDATCSDPFLQASLLSLVPSYFAPVTSPEEMTSERLLPIVRWFQSTFRVLPLNKESSVTLNLESNKSFACQLSDALAERAGTIEEIAALSVAVFRSLGFVTRYVSVLDVASLKPDSESLDASSEWDSTKDRLEGFYPGMSQRRLQAASFAKALAGLPSRNLDIQHTKSAGRGSLPQMKLGCPHRKIASPQAQNLDRPSLTSDQKAAERSVLSKADREFELQLAMAITATAAASEAHVPLEEGSEQQPSGGHTDGDLVCAVNSSSGRKAGFNLLFRKRKKEDDVGNGTSGSVWSRKKGPLLHWAEVFCCNDTIAGKWVHVDAGNGIVDGVDKVEGAAAACRLPLRYVVAFAGSGAKDVTLRYSPLWSRIASLRVQEDWWNSTLRPLKQLEAAATSSIMPNNQVATSSKLQPMNISTPGQAPISGPSSGGELQGVSSQLVDQAYSDPIDRSAWEDIELESRALKEPLPTSQQAYKNHHLYVLEKWLTKYQAIYPKGPVLGSCAGQPVYPRSYVQNLHTAEHWLREGRKVTPGEAPYKVVKKSRLAAKETDSEGKEVGGLLPTSDVFGIWQTKPWRPPAAVNGVVPKNERGQVDVWSEKCLPPGTVHLRYPRLVPIARHLGVDYAPAFIGFEVQRGQALPKFEGIVVCKEFETAILEAYWQEESRRAEGLRRRQEEQALLRWWQLLRAVTTRERLRAAYENGNNGSNHQNSESESRKGLASSHSFEDHARESDERSEQLRASHSSTGVKATQEMHVHCFVEEGKPDNSVSGSRMKRCTCGLSIEVEEI